MFKFKNIALRFERRAFLVSFLQQNVKMSLLIRFFADKNEHSLSGSGEAKGSIRVQIIKSGAAEGTRRKEV